LFYLLLLAFFLKIKTISNPILTFGGTSIPNPKYGNPAKSGVSSSFGFQWPLLINPQVFVKPIFGVFGFNSFPSDNPGIILRMGRENLIFNVLEFR